MKYRWLLLAAFVTLALGAAYDTDGDGVLDYRAGALRDDDCDGSLDFGLPGQAQPVSDSLEFGLAWTSGSELNNQWDASCGDFDHDGRLDIQGHHFNPTELHVFESDGAGGYQPVWQQTESLLRLSQLVTDFPEIAEMDINPLKVQPEHGGAIAIDARIALRE